MPNVTVQPWWHETFLTHGRFTNRPYAWGAMDRAQTVRELADELPMRMERDGSGVVPDA